MAANMKSVKLRIKSVQSTMQITKAMHPPNCVKPRNGQIRAAPISRHFMRHFRILQKKTQIFLPYMPKKFPATNIVM